MGKFQSSKVFDGFSTVFRQWKATDTPSSIANFAVATISCLCTIWVMMSKEAAVKLSKEMTEQCGLQFHCECPCSTYPHLC